MIGGTVDYQEFVAAKSQLSGQFGFAPVWMPDFLFDFQRDLVTWAVERGRGAIFADCGLGKTPMQLVWAENVVRHTNGRVLVLTPLCVGSQTVREGEKFGIPCRQVRDGKLPAERIVVTNYEQLHHFSPSDFAGCVCDECFPGDTLVDVLNINNTSTQKYIRDIRIGDRILNASGVDHVTATQRRRIDRAVRFAAGSDPITCSSNHLIFTLHGWKRAGDLQPGDYIMETATSMCLVWKDLPSAQLGLKTATFLRNILLSEMENAHSRAQGEGTQPHSGQEAGGSQVSLVQKWKPGSTARAGESCDHEHYEQPSDARKTVCDSESQGVEACRPGRERTGLNSPAGQAATDPRPWVGGGTRNQPREENAGISDLLQGGPGQPADDDCHRGGRPHAQIQEGAGQEEGHQAGFARVDSVEVLELGHPDLDRWRDEAGDVYFYDLEAERHPSFSVNGLLVHNSAILKNFNGVTRKAVTEFMRKMPYRLLCTATAAPNDFIELGTSSEALGELGNADMLSRFFKRDTGFYRQENRGGQGWRLREYGHDDFWRWVCSWARSLRKPSDMGYDDGAFLLPPMESREHIVKASRPREGFLFDLPAVTLDEQRDERRRTLPERCGMAASLVEHTGQPAVCWCHLNAEGDMLKRLIPGSVQVSGSDTDEHKERTLERFAAGDIRVLVTKPTIAGFGLNWQHCAHQTFFPSHSFEQFYQAVRRCWRFGQDKTVVVDVISSEGERGVLENLQRKARASDEMFGQLTRLMHDELVITTQRNTASTEGIQAWLRK